MDTTSFLQLVLNGNEAEALARVECEPALAAARNSEGVSVICLAVYAGRRALASELARRRERLDIFEASCVGDATRVRQLCAEDAALANAVSPDGFGALGYSAFFGHIDALRALLAHGARVDAPSRNAMGVYPINSAAAHSDQQKAIALVQSLLEAGADPNSRQASGYTVLQEAAFDGNVPLIRLLVARGADRQLVNPEGQTALEIARTEGHPDAVRELEEPRTD